MECEIRLRNVQAISLILSIVKAGKTEENIKPEYKPTHRKHQSGIMQNIMKASEIHSFKAASFSIANSISIPK